MVLRIYGRQARTVNRVKCLRSSNHIRQRKPADRLRSRSSKCRGAKEKRFCSIGTDNITVSNIAAPPNTHHIAAFGARSMLPRERVQERLTRMIVRKETTSAANANARAAFGP